MTREEAIKEIKSWDFLEGKELEAIGTLIPELKESEDERIYNEIMEFFKMNEKICVVNNSYPKWIAWLEKQKENKEKEYVFRPLAGTDITIAAEQAIQRANEGDRLVLAFNGAYIPVKKGCSVNKIVDIYDAFIEKQKEQKPVISDEAIRDGVIHFGITQHQINNWLKKYINVVEQKPAEWSEEEKKIIGNIRHLIFEHAFENGGVDVNGDYCKDVYQEADDFLKSLRPQSKQDVFPSLSEKEIIFLKRALDYLRKEHNRYGGEDFTNEIAVLEWLITHPILVSDTHWKPSEEQMKQLNSAADLPEFGPMVTTRKQFPDLESLYEQLKKLM